MPHIANNVLGNLNQTNATDLRNQLTEFEQLAGAPVRVLMPQAGRTVAGMQDNWSGASANMANYPGFSEEDRDERGITILCGSFNSEVHTEGEFYDYLYLTSDLYEEFNRERPAEIEIRTPPMDPQAITDSEGIPLEVTRPNGETSLYGEIYGRVAFLRMTFGAYTNWGRANYSALLFDKLIENVSPEAREAAERRRAEMQREIFTRMMEDQGNSQIIDLRDKAAAAASTISEAEVTLTNARIDSEQIAKQLNYLLESQGELSTKEIQEEWEAISKHASVKSFTLGKSSTGGEREAPRNRRRREEGRAEDETQSMGAWLKLKTHPLWITHPNTKRKILLGEFEITLNFGSNRLTIKNLTNAMDNGRWDHPHVERNTLCAADYGSTITELLRKRKLAGMTGMIFNILKTLTMSDLSAVNNMRLWEEADDRLRRENGWPAWEEGEEVHPSLNPDEEDSDGDPEPADAAETEENETETEGEDETNG